MFLIKRGAKVTHARSVSDTSEERERGKSSSLRSSFSSFAPRGASSSQLLSHLRLPLRPSQPRFEEAVVEAGGKLDAGGELKDADAAQVLPNCDERRESHEDYC